MFDLCDAYALRWFGGFDNSFCCVFGCFEVLGIFLGVLIFEEMLLDESVYFYCHQEEGFHEVAVLHYFVTIGRAFSEFLPVNIVSTRDFLSLVTFEYFDDVRKRVELDGWRVVV